MFANVVVVVVAAGVHFSARKAHSHEPQESKPLVSRATSGPRRKCPLSARHNRSGHLFDARRGANQIASRETILSRWISSRIWLVSATCSMLNVVGRSAGFPQALVAAPAAHHKRFEHLVKPFPSPGSLTQALVSRPKLRPGRSSRLCYLTLARQTDRRRGGRAASYGKNLIRK